MFTRICIALTRLKSCTLGIVLQKLIKLCTLRSVLQELKKVCTRRSVLKELIKLCTLGSVLHELGHCFDLGHTEEGIMGRGFDDLDLFFTLTGPFIFYFI